MASEFIVNGNFESGNSGFTTDYLYVPPGSGALVPQGRYTVDNNPRDSHNSFAIMGDHTSGTGLMMILNGVANDSVVWEQTLTGLTFGESYTFSGWASSVYPTSPARLEFRVNGTSLGTLNLSSTTALWVQKSVTYVAASSTATLSIVDINGAATGNDFAIDDLSFMGSSGTTIFPLSYTIVDGIPFGGNVASLAASDDDKVYILNDESTSNATIVFTGTGAPAPTTSVTVTMETSATRNDLSEFQDSFNYSSNEWVNLGGTSSSLTDVTQVRTLPGTGAAFVSGTGEVRSRIRWIPQVDLEAADGWAESTDFVKWTVR